MILPKERAINTCFKQINSFNHIVETDLVFASLTMHEKFLIKNLKFIPSAQTKNKWKVKKS